MHFPEVVVFFFKYSWARYSQKTGWYCLALVFKAEPAFPQYWPRGEDRNYCFEDNEIGK